MEQNMTEQGRAGSMPMLVVLFVSAFVAAYNENIINVALMDIMGQFNVGSATAQWLVTGYMILTTIVATVMAFLIQRFTLRRLFFSACGFLIVGEVLCLLAPTFPLLLVCRLMQAIGTGIFIPLMMNTVLATAPKTRLGSYLSVGGAAITLGPAFAPVVSGIMVTYFGWRSIFVLPCAITAVLLIAGIFLIHNFAETRAVRVDVASLVLVAVGLTLFVYGIGEITTNLIVAAITLVVSIVAIGVFVRRQGSLTTPLLDMRPMKKSRFSLACILVIVAMMTSFSMSVLLPLYYEGALGTTALLAGALILPPIAINAGTAIVGGRLMDRRGEWPLLPAGFLLIVCGLAVVALLSGSMSMLAVVLGSVVVYGGIGLIMSPSQTAGLKTLPREQYPSGVSIMSTLLMVSASIGPSLFIGILSSGAATAAAAGASAASAQAAGFSAAILVATGIAAAGLLIAFFYALRAHKTPITVPVSGSAAGAGADTANPADAAGDQSATETQVPCDKTAVDRMAARATGHTDDLAAVMKADVFTVPSTASVREVARMLVEAKTSGIPVVDEAQRVVGFVSDGDIMRGLSKQETVPADLSYYVTASRDDATFDEKVAALLDMNVMDIATKHVVTVDRRTSLVDVCTVLTNRKIKKLPVVDDGQLVGTVSRSDIVRYLMDGFAGSSAQTDEA